MLPPPAERPKLKMVLDQLCVGIEELLLGGLTTVSEATRQTISVALQEAARFRLLRLGQTLRISADELGRFNRQAEWFSRRRLTFFLGRTWLLSRGISRALETTDEAEYDRLSWSPPTRPLSSAEVVCVGAVKKVTESFVAFDFRLRATADAAPIRAGQRLTWSAVFPIKSGSELPPEAFLHLPQKQKFAPILFLNPATVVIQNAAISTDDAGTGRIALGEGSIVAAGKPFAGWARFLEWSPAPAAGRLARHKPGPLDLDNELLEEVVLRDYEIGPPGDGDEPGLTTYPVTAGGLAFHAVVGAGDEGKTLRKGLDALRKTKKNRPPLFGLMHYERCRLVLQPLTAFGQGGPDHLAISKEIVDKAALLKAMTFT